jgi:hypothetical protein
MAAKQGGRPVPLVVMGHGSGATLLHRQAGLPCDRGPGLALLIDAEHHGVCPRIDIEAVAQLVDELGVLRQLELAPAMG